MEFALETGMLGMFLWVVFFAATMLAIGVGAILAFHWLRYAMNPAAPLFAVITYGGVCFGCLSVMFGILMLPS